MKKKCTCLLLVIVCLVFAGKVSEVVAAGKDFPTKPLNFIVPMGPGGGGSLMARAISQKAGELLGVPIIVKNKPGGGGTIGVDFVRRSKPDGYTFTQCAPGMNVTAIILRNVPYKNDDFEFLGMYATNYVALAVNSNSQWKTLEELIDYAKNHPGELKYTTLGKGSSTHIASLIFNKEAGIQIVPVPYKSDPEMLTSVLGGHCHFGFFPNQSIVPAVEGGKIRALAVTSEMRLKNLPNAPTFIEKGYPRVVYSIWYGLIWPKGLPRKVHDRLKDVFGWVFQDDEFHIMMEKLGVFATYMPAEEFTNFVHSEEKRIRTLLKEVGIERID